MRPSTLAKAGRSLNSPVKPVAASAAVRGKIGNPKRESAVIHKRWTVTQPAMKSTAASVSVRISSSRAAKNLKPRTHDQRTIPVVTVLQAIRIQPPANGRGKKASPVTMATTCVA